MARYYVTTPIYYVNDVPHIGHAYTTIAADVLARYHRLRGDDVFFLTGTDEHGQKVEEAAAKKGVRPKAYADLVSASFLQAWKELGISHDKFIRTTDESHQKAAQELIRRCHAKGDIYLGEYEGLYCSGCEQFYLEKELFDNKCPIHKSTVQRIKEPSYFFKLSKYQDKLLALYKNHPEFISPAYRRDEVINRVKEGLRDLSISRTGLDWGIPFPLGTGHVVYVWFDALSNYISALGWPDEKGRFKEYWPADVHLIGKEIAWFHCVIWPAMLLSAGITPPKKVFSHGWLTIEGQKMSKSLGNFVQPGELVHRYGADATRYFLLYNVPFGQDGDFSEARLVAHVNAELADGYGNLLSRTLALVEKHFDGKWPAPAGFTRLEDDLVEAAARLDKEYHAAIGGYEFHRALEATFAFVRYVNKYVSETTPWKITDQPRLATVLYATLEALRVITHYLAPFVPTLTANAAKQLGQPVRSFNDATFKPSTKGKTAKGGVLLPKISVPEQSHPFSKLNLRVGHVAGCQPHPDAEKLFVLRVNLGSEERTLVAGLRAHYTSEQLIGKHVIIVANLKPAKLRGIVSQGMVLAADAGGVVKVLEAPHAHPGEPVTIAGVKSGTKEITIDDVINLKMTTTLQRVLVDGQPLCTPTGEIVVDMPDGATIR